ncbi:MAG: hypothetical protein ACI3XR_10415 [Eubacteriales bacterium]
MKKHKKLLLSLAVLCLTTMVLASCGGGEGNTTTKSDSTQTTTTAAVTPGASTTNPATSPDPSTDEKAYVFTVVCGDTNQPVSGAQVQICKGDEFCLMPVATDSDGKANYVLTGGNDYGEYDVHIIGGIPEGYTFDNASVKTTADTHNYTLTLVKSGEETSPKTSGEATGAPTTTNPPVTNPPVTNPPATNPPVTNPPATNPPATNPPTPTTSAPIITTTKPAVTTQPGTDNPPAACQHTFVNEICTKCGETKTYNYTLKVVYDYDCEDADGVSHKAGDPISGVEMVFTNGEMDHLYAKGTTDKNGEITFTAPKYVETQVYDGVKTEVAGFTITVTGGMPEGFMHDPLLAFQPGATTHTISFYPKPVQGERTAFNPDTLKAGVTVKVSLGEARMDDIDDFWHTPQDDSLYYYAFRPTKQSDVGVYRVTITNLKGASSVYIGNYPNSGYGYVAYSPDYSDSGANPSFEFIIEDTYLKNSDGEWTFDNKWLFGVRADDANATYPVTFDLKIERIRDIVPGQDVPIYDYVYPDVPANAPKADAITGSVDGKTLGYVSTDVELVKDSKGYYHVGSVDGPMVMLLISSANRILGSEGLTFCNVNTYSGAENLSASTYDEATNTYTIYKYESMLQQYGTLCNEDGAYPVNDQLLDFLKLWVSQKASTVPATVDKDHAYLYACSIYQ